MDDAGLPPVTIFASPKDLGKQRDPWKQANQRRTFECWSRLAARSTVVFTQDPATAEAARAQHLRVDAKFALHPQYGQPTYKALFDRAFAVGATDIVIYTNGDIFYTRSLLETVASVHSAATRMQTPPYKFMVVGQRVNLELTDQSFAWQTDWEAQVLDLAEQGVPFQADAEDYFAISRALWEEIHVPPFVVGGSAFDNWLVSRAIRTGHLIVDGSLTAVAVHINHGSLKGSHSEAKSKYNTELGRKNGGWAQGAVTDCKWFTARDASTGRVMLWDRKGRLLRA